MSRKLLEIADAFLLGDTGKCSSGVKGHLTDDLTRLDDVIPVTS